MPAGRTAPLYSAIFIALAGACDEPRPAPTPVTPEPAPEAPLPVPEAPDPAPEPARPAPGAARPLVLGADRSRLLILDPSSEPWTPTQRDAAPIDALHAVAWLDGGALLAGRSTRVAAVWRRDGTPVGHAAIPDLVEALGERLTARLAQAEEAYGGALEPRDAIDVGPLVRTEAGALAMDPLLGPLSEEGGCAEPISEWRLPLSVAGVAPGPTVAAELAAVPLAAPRGRAPPEGWRCARVPVEGDHRSPRWAPGLDAMIGALPLIEGGDCGEDAAPTDPWERLASCYTDLSGVGVCRFREDPQFFLSLVAAEAMGCTSGPESFVLEGRRLLARTGSDAELRVLGDLWLFGGRAQQYVGGPGRTPLRFGRARPDVILASPP